MQFLGSKIISVLILLNTTICLAMQRSIGYDPYMIGIASATCENRVYSKLQISFAIIGGLQSISQMEANHVDLDAVQYKPQPREVMPSRNKFYFTEIQRLGPNGPTDLVIFSRNGQFAKVVTRVQDSQGFKNVDCVPSQITPSPFELQPIWGISGQNSGVLDPFGIGTTSVSCEDRIYDKRQISKAITAGILNIAKLNRLEQNLDVMQYKPKPTEVMPFNDNFYFSELEKLTPHGPIDLVVFSSSGQFAKAVILKEDGDDFVHIDCVSSSNRQSPERSPSRMGSPKRLPLSMGSPEPSQLSTGSSKRRRLRTKSPEHESLE